MDALRQWAICLIIGAAAGTFVMSVSPRGSMDKTVRAVVGIFVVAVICSPLADFKKTDFAFNTMTDYKYDERDSTEKIHEYMLSVCREEMNKQILSAAEEHGLTVNEIFINADIDAENCMIIHDMMVEIGAEHSEKSNEFSEILSQKIGVPVKVATE